jgi:transposase-like protein
MGLIEQACQGGARLHKACKQIGITCRTLQRWLRLLWRVGPISPAQSQRPGKPWPVPCAQTVAKAHFARA